MYGFLTHIAFNLLMQGFLTHFVFKPRNLCVKPIFVHFTHKFYGLNTSKVKNPIFYLIGLKIVRLTQIKKNDHNTKKLLPARITLTYLILTKNQRFDIQISKK